ncbi:hypothetical protein HanIR_Chr08g0374581 [Helianthus annuus]|nr:hypothetical protein HanIR_Chr08g0374581 [Helianthus annuus]
MLLRSLQILTNSDEGIRTMRFFGASWKKCVSGNIRRQHLRVSAPQACFLIPWSEPKNKLVQ